MTKIKKDLNLLGLNCKRPAAAPRTGNRQNLYEGGVFVRVHEDTTYNSLGHHKKLALTAGIRLSYTIFRTVRH